MASKRNCDEELKALTSVHKFDGSSSDSTIDVSIPKESQIGLTARNWVDSHKDWLLQQYQSTYDEIMRDNFRTPKDATIESVTLTTRESEAIKKLEDEQYLRRILDKLMDYANARYRLSGVSTNSQEFTDAYIRHKADYEQCRQEISKVNQEIEQKLRNKRTGGDDAQKLTQQIEFYTNKISTINDKINRDSRDLNNQLDEKNKQIREYEISKASRQSLINEL